MLWSQVKAPAAQERFQVHLHSLFAGMGMEICVRAATPPEMLFPKGQVHASCTELVN